MRYLIKIMDFDLFFSKNIFFSQLSSKLNDEKRDETGGVINRGYVSHECSELNGEKTKANWSYPFPHTQRRVLSAS